VDIDVLITREMWTDWKKHPVTQEYFRRIAAHREGMKEELADGRAEKEMLPIYIGECRGYKFALTYGLHDFEFDIEEEPTDD
jgi:hypothetical protein